MPALLESSVGDMSAGLHTANLFSSPNVCPLRNDLFVRIAHNANMETEKNGGPNYLQAWRKFRRMSQEELADSVGTTKAVISLLESGNRPLSAKWLRKIAPVLKTTPGHLLDHDPNELPTDVIDIWTHIAEQDRPRVIRVLESFKTGTDD